MKNAHHHYETIARAITYLQTHFQDQPTLEEVAKHVHLSPFHFQWVFTEWAGVSPKKFLQFLSVEHAKQLLMQGDSALHHTAHATGLSGTSRLHDLFVTIEAMTPATYRNGGQGLTITYDFRRSVFGSFIVAATERGICYLAFIDGDDEQPALASLQACFPQAQCSRGRAPIHDQAEQLLNPEPSITTPVQLHLAGSPFQLKVWQALLTIPAGQRFTYGQLARSIEQPKASRAVGTAIGKNPVAFLIPCHRVIRATGESGGYRWGPVRKQAILGWESAKHS